ncbi:MAG TPA: ABC transporter substrate-binding protein [Alphaproteobacteria bacterium]|nr:ABC transporter substrate-binding protein [Alphaproteobacteria bacterium]
MAGAFSANLALAQDDQLEDTLIVRTTGSAFEDALVKHYFTPFTEETGVTVIPVASSYGEMVSKTAAMVEAGNAEWDIISPQFYELQKLSPYLMDLGDCSEMPNVASEGIPGICGQYGVQYLQGGVVLAYNPTMFPDEKPDSWADFWDTESFPGGRALPSYGNPWGNVFLFALMADGVAPGKLFPLDLDRAFASLDEIKSEIDVWWKTGAQSVDLMRSGEIAMTPMWSGTAYAAKADGVPLEWTFNQAIADRGSWAIVKGAPHPNAAKAFIDFYMTNPENHANFAREIGYLTTNAKARTLLSEEKQDELVPEGETVDIDADWVEENRESALERWNAWLAQ